jgi:hypothetical protein
MAVRVITYRNVECAIDPFSHIKVQEWMAYSRDCCRRDGKLLSLTFSGCTVLACLLAMFQPYGGKLR